MQLTVQELEHIRAMIRQEAVSFCESYVRECDFPLPEDFHEQICKSYDEWKVEKE